MAGNVASRNPAPSTSVQRAEARKSPKRVAALVLKKDAPGPRDVHRAGGVLSLPIPGAIRSRGRRRYRTSCIATVLMVLAGASGLIGVLRSPTDPSMASINANTPNVRRTSTGSRINRGRRERRRFGASCDRCKRAICSGVVIRIRNSTRNAPPKHAQRRLFQTTICSLSLTDYLSVIGEVWIQVDRGSFNPTGIKLWISWG